MIENFSNLFITTEPGTTYRYTNIGFSIAGLLVDKISGQTYDDYVTEHIFKPLNMPYTCVLPTKNSSSAMGHFPGINEAIVSQDKGVLSGEFIPAGKFSESNTLDLANYLMMYLNKGIFEEIKFFLLN